MEQEREQPNEELDTNVETPPETPPETLAPVQPSIDEIRNTYNQMFLEQQAEIRKLREAQQTKPAPRPEDIEQDKQLLFDDPRRLLREEVSEQIKPLIEFQQGYQRQQMLDGFKSQMRADALKRFKHLDKISNYFDRAVQGLAQLTPESVVGAYNLALGAYLTDGGSLEVEQPKETPASPPKPNESNMSTIPPHARPSAPVRSAPAKANKPVLTENEKKIARFNNMTDEEYVQWRDLDATQVVTQEKK